MNVLEARLFFVHPGAFVVGMRVGKCLLQARD